jgi:capsular polysaccharide transport system permease protein
MAFYLMMVVVPTTLTVLYLYILAVDQYASRVGFVVRTEEVGSAVELLGGITELSGSSSSDTDILYEFIQSQDLVQRIDARLDLGALYSRSLARDPVFSFDPEKPVEDLLSYWKRMVRISYDGGTGLIELQVLAFDPQDAQKIATAIYEESTQMINALSAVAREDATRYAREELDRSLGRLREARASLLQFRNQYQIVDPISDLQVLLGVINTLQQQLANALIELDLLRENTRAGDPRLIQAERRIEVIEARIVQERRKFGTGSGDNAIAYSQIVGDYERLVVDQEFAERANTNALTAYDAALSEAQRQSRYLAAYIQPTLAQSAQYPRRKIITVLVFTFLFIGWAILTLAYYSVRDRR